jgi:hypothetical protein
VGATARFSAQCLQVHAGVQAHGSGGAVDVQCEAPSASRARGKNCAWQAYPSTHTRSGAPHAVHIVWLEECPSVKHRVQSCMPRRVACTHRAETTSARGRSWQEAVQYSVKAAWIIDKRGSAHVRTTAGVCQLGHCTAHQMHHLRRKPLVIHAIQSRRSGHSAT